MKLLVMKTILMVVRAKVVAHPAVRWWTWRILGG